jgi:caffeoyl-CoA O-methyltransferase
MGRAITNFSDRLHDYLVANQPPEHEELRKLRERTASMPNARLQIAVEQGHLLCFLTKLVGARRVLEIGTFTGYSALVFALALPTDGLVVTCDVNDEWVSVGRAHWERAGVTQKIDVRIGVATDSLTRLEREVPFDLAFIDANKEDYDAYYEAALKLVKPGGLVVLDNMLFHGAVAAPDTGDARTKAIRALNTKIASDSRSDRVMLPVGDGMTLVRVR